MIQFFHVNKTYPGDPPALTDVSVQVEKGEMVFLTGASGAGKSTFLKLIFGAETASTGQVVIHGQNVARLGRTQLALLRRRIGVVYQDFRLLQNRTVFENIALSLHVQGVPTKEVRRKVALLLRYVGLAERAHVIPSRISGGEQQRVAIARALAADPAVLLADEPTGNLDVDRSEDIMELLKQVNARGTTVLIASHDRALLQRYAKRIIVLERGRVTADGVLDEVPRLSSPPPVRAST